MKIYEIEWKTGNAYKDNYRRRKWWVKGTSLKNHIGQDIEEFYTLQDILQMEFEEFENIAEKFYLKLNKPYATSSCWLNLVDEDDVALYNKTETNEYKTKFTRKDIDELVDKFGKYIKEDFEAVPVMEGENEN